MYPGDNVCILVTSQSACQGVSRHPDGIRHVVGVPPTVLGFRFWVLEAKWAPRIFRFLFSVFGMGWPRWRTTTLRRDALQCVRVFPTPQFVAPAHPQLRRNLSVVGEIASPLQSICNRHQSHRADRQLILDGVHQNLLRNEMRTLSQASVHPPTNRSSSQYVRPNTQYPVWCHD